MVRPSVTDFSNREVGHVRNSGYREMFYRLVQAEITVKYHNDMLLKGNGKPA